MNNVIDNIFRKISNNNVCMGGKLLIGTCDPTQIQPINARPLLTSTNVTPCYTIVPISTSVRTHEGIFSGCNKLIDYRVLKENYDLTNEFEQLCDGFTFVDSWNDDKITPETFRIHARNVPVKEASRNFV